jgi:excisionase family DNA binding protein
MTQDLTVPEAARALHIHAVALRRMLTSGRIRAYRLPSPSGRRPHWRIPAEVIEELRRCAPRARSVPVPACGLGR